jgi:ParB-like chromosome segregation protein Spo0J
MSYPRVPAHTEAAYAALRASIAEVRRILSPVVRNERGETVDGRAREQIAEELGIVNYPVEVVSGLTEEGEWRLHAALNLHRRQLDRDGKRRYIEECLRYAPDRTDNWIAELCGADHHTVTKARRKLEALREIPEVQVFKGKDAKSYHRFTSILTTTARHARQAEEALRRIGTHGPGRTIRLAHAQRLAQRVARAEHRNGPAPPPPRHFKLECCDFRKLEARNLDLIYTDPYWNDAKVWHDLGAWAAKALRPGGILCAYTGQAVLLEALAGLGQHLRYHWCAAMLHPAEKTWLHRWAVKSGWAPLVFFSKGAWPPEGRRPYFIDIYSAPTKEKEYDEHQQSEAEALYYIDTLSDRGALVADPFGGSFTTAVACLKLGRRFIGCDIRADQVAGGLNRLQKERERMRLHRQ